MARVVHISIGSNHKSADTIEAILRTFWLHLANTVPYEIRVRDDHTIVIFLTEDESLQLLENIPETIAGVDNVKFEECTRQTVLIPIGEVEGVDSLTKDANQQHDDKLILKIKIQLLILIQLISLIQQSNLIKMKILPIFLVMTMKSLCEFCVLNNFYLYNFCFRYLLQFSCITSTYV